MLGMLLALAAFYFSRGRIALEPERGIGPQDPALQRLRALHALDDGDLLHRAGDLGAQLHLRQAPADAADRAGRLRGLVAMGEIRPQLSVLAVHARRRCS